MEFVKVYSLHVEYLEKPKNWLRKKWIYHKTLRRRTIMIDMQ